MNTRLAFTGIDPFEHPIDQILAEIAFIIQLPPSLHEKAISRYQAVRNHLESTSCHFKDDIEHFYPQGSMAIDATISTRGTDDEYDIDIIAQLGRSFRSMSPLAILKELEEGLTGYRGMQVVRQTRCVTLFYEDHMHLDVTPSLRDRFTPDRQSCILHAKGPNPSPDDCRVPMNAYGFVEWYNERTPVETRVVEAFSRRWIEEGRSATAASEVDDVPDQTEFVVKNVATLALQLLKRYRNIRYANRPGRMPPSVMLAYYAALLARPNMRLTDMLVSVAERIFRDIESAERNGELLHVANPRYDDDIFTDRWPADRLAQARFARDLRELVEGLQQARRGGMLADAVKDWMRETFGDRVVTGAIDRIAERMGTAIRSGTQTYSRAGRVLAPAASTSAIPSAAAGSVTGSRHTFYGEVLE